MAGNTNYSTLVTTTLQNFSNEIFDNVVTNNSLLRLLKKAGNIKVVSGGRTLTETVFYQKNTNFAARPKLDPIPLNIDDELTRAEYNVKVLSGAIMISQLDLAMNAGDKEKLIDLIESKKMAAEVSLGELMGDQIFNTAVTAAGSDNFDSIPYLISETPSLQSDVGGIDSTASGQAYWRNQIYATTVSGFATSQEGLNAMSRLYNLCINGTQGPTAVITTRTIFSLYELALTSNARYTSMDTGDGAFKSLNYATLPVYFDDNCPSAALYFVDTNSLRLKVLDQGNMKATKFQQTQNQLSTSMLMYVFGNLTCASRRTQGVMINITG